VRGPPITATPPRALMRELAELRVVPRGVLSLYLDLEPSLFPTQKQRQMEIKSLIDEAAVEFTRRDGLSHEEHRTRLEALERLRDRLSARELVKDGTRSVAAFVSPAADVFEVMDLGLPVPPTCVVSDSPYLRPLADEAGPRTWAVLLLDRRRARLLYGGERRLIEVTSFEDDVPSHQKQGGWSAERYQRHSDEHASDHIDRALGALFRFFEQTRFDALAIAGPERAFDEAVGGLHPYLKERFKGRIDIEVSFHSPGEVLATALPLFQRARDRAVDDLLATLSESPREKVAIGTDAVFEMLFERRVEVLITEDRYTLDGVRCPECFWIGSKGSICPNDGVATEERADVIDDCIDLAWQQAARVVRIADGTQEPPPGHIAALLRY
jgi:hypothetical protein